MQNEYKKPEVPKKPKKKAGKPRGESKVGKAIRSLLDGTILTRETAVRLLPFVLFLTAICIAYIANSYYAEKTLRQSITTRKEIKELENEYLSSKSELMMCSKQSEVAALLDTTGVVESVVPPKKIFVNNNK
jgi:hypothetical protein